MYVYEYPFRKAGECPIDAKIADTFKDGIILGWTTVKEGFELGGEYSKGDVPPCACSAKISSKFRQLLGLDKIAHGVCP